ncbi:hypothetical protein DGWBC_1541 [Dehalogenimonas sp. WBC-2]|nr:hypothetical protein DGWBC_1541 [Dehalogenimonas sp. WBC-2]
MAKIFRNKLVITVNRNLSKVKVAKPSSIHLYRHAVAVISSPETGAAFSVKESLVIY